MPSCRRRTAPPRRRGRSRSGSCARGDPARIESRFSARAVGPSAGRARCRGSRRCAVGDGRPDQTVVVSDSSTRCQASIDTPQPARAAAGRARPRVSALGRRRWVEHLHLAAGEPLDAATIAGVREGGGGAARSRRRPRTRWARIARGGRRAGGVTERRTSLPESSRAEAVRGRLLQRGRDDPHDVDRPWRVRRRCPRGPSVRLFE